MREDEEFAGELASVRVPPRVRAWTARVRAAFGTGLLAGFLPSVPIGAIYFALHHEQDLPWVKIASILALFGPFVGTSVSTMIELMVLAFDRIARFGFGLHAMFNPIVAGGLGGALAGLTPGVIGVTVFGSYTGAFVGTGLIAFGLISGAVMITIPAARRARAARQLPRNDRAIVAAAVIATLILCAVAAVVAPVMIDVALRRAQGAIRENGAIVGAASGVVAGGIVGVYIGLVIALGRRR